MKLLFLAHEISGYFLACLRELTRTSEHSVLLLRKPVSSDYPIELSPDGRIESIDCDGVNASLWSKIENFSPDCIVTCGWIHRYYMAIARKYRDRIPVVCAIDNCWKGGIRQLAGATFSRLTFSKYFSHAWVPGARQYEFARNLGFAPERIQMGLYTADTPAFASDSSSNESDSRKTLLYLGRLVGYKNPALLYKLFHELSDQERNGWTLVFSGTGPLADRVPPSEFCQHSGFVQPADVPRLIQKSSACVLPSSYEHWGVAIHEFAAAGKPIISTLQCAATDEYLVDRVNGYKFDARRVDDFRQAIVSICQSSQTERMEMGRVSRELSKSNSPSIWSVRMTGFLRSTNR